MGISVPHIEEVSDPNALEVGYPYNLCWPNIPVERRFRQTRAAAATGRHVEGHLTALSDHSPHGTLAAEIIFHETEELVETADKETTTTTQSTTSSRTPNWPFTIL